MATHPLDAMTAAPDHHAVLIEYHRVRVLDMRLGPGEQTPVHAHEWPAALYVPSWSDFVRRAPDGTVLWIPATGTPPERGAALWLPALEPHYVTNVSNGELRSSRSK